MDVVLDTDKALVVQPDIVFVATPHLDRIRDRIWGAPDLVVEVLSRGSARRDRTTKLAWYAQYGVTECWLIDLAYHFVEVVDLQRQPPVWVRYEGDLAVRSRVLPQWDTTAAAIFS
jgi:Uma2 family endonuclease